MIVTKHEDKMIVVMKGSLATIKSTMTVTKNFLIEKKEVCGTGLKVTVIMMKC